jgi:hypothetical protein
MSLITDLVFVLPGTCDSRRHTTRFADIFEHRPTGRRGTIAFRPEPIKDNGSKVSGNVVFHLAASFVDPDFLDEITSEQWPLGTVLMHQDENDDYPHVVVWGEHGPVWHEWSTCHRCGLRDNEKPHDCLKALNAEGVRNAR